MLIGAPDEISNFGGREGLLKGLTEAGKPVQLIIGGDDHALSGEKIGQTYLVEGGGEGKTIGIATIMIDKATNKTYITWKYKIFYPSDPQDTRIVELIQDYFYTDPFELRHMPP